MTTGDTDLVAKWFPAKGETRTRPEPVRDSYVVWRTAEGKFAQKFRFLCEGQYLEGVGEGRHPVDALIAACHSAEAAYMEAGRGARDEQ